MRRDGTGRRWAGRTAGAAALVVGLVVAAGPAPQPLAAVASSSAATVAATSTAAGSPEGTASGTTTVDLVQDDTPAGDVVRPYVLTVPASGGGPRPLVVALHGRSQTIDSLRAVSGLEQLGEKAGFVTAFPSGWAGVWNAGTCCDARSAPDMPDVDYLDAVVADVAQRTPVDLTRVHVVGFSNGGMMAYRYACQRSASVAGVAVVSGSMAASPDYADHAPQVCRPTAPVSVIAVHGSKDTTVPYEGGAVAGTTNGSVAPVRGGVDQSAVGASCRTGRSSKVGATVRLDYTDCADGAAVRLVKVQGQGHGWTRDSAKYGYDTSVGIWTFLKDRRATSAR